MGVAWSTLSKSGLLEADGGQGGLRGVAWSTLSKSGLLEADRGKGGLRGVAWSTLSESGLLEADGGQEGLRGVARSTLSESGLLEADRGQGGLGGVSWSKHRNHLVKYCKQSGGGCGAGRIRRIFPVSGKQPTIRIRNLDPNLNQWRLLGHKCCNLNWILG